MDIATVAIVALPSFAAGALGMAFLHTRMAPSCEDRVNAPGDDAFTIARLTDELEAERNDNERLQFWNEWLGSNAESLLAENDRLRRADSEGGQP